MNVEDLRSMNEEELMRSHDRYMQNRAEHYNIFLDELSRREASRQGERMESLTKSINRLTLIITAATIVGVILTAWGVLFG